MKSIVLAGGSGTRLYPTTHVVSKQLLSVYDKPMIYYSLSVLLLAGIREILVISTPRDLPLYQALFGDGSQWGVDFSYAAQAEPRGIAEAFLIGRDFIGKDSCALVLGDNIFYGHGLSELLNNVVKRTGDDLAARPNGAAVFASWVSDPERYAVVEFDNKGRVTSIVDRAEKSESNWAVTGIYFYDNRVVDMAAELNTSSRNRMEITNINQAYLEIGDLSVERLSRGLAWMDSTSHRDLLQAAEFIYSVENRQGLKIACIEEIVYHMGYIDRAKLEVLAQPLANNAYGQYLLRIARD